MSSVDIPAGISIEAETVPVARFTAVPPIVGEGAFSELQCDAEGNLKVRAEPLPLGAWVPATAAAPADSGVISATAKTVYNLIAVNSGEADVWLHLFDLAAHPVNGGAPRLPAILIPATGQPVLIDFGGGMAFENGVSWASSSTVATLTLTALTSLQVSAEVSR